MENRFSNKLVYRLCFIATLVTVLIWFSCIARCEALTLHHGIEFENLWQDHTMLDEPQQLKVLEYKEE